MPFVSGLEGWCAMCQRKDWQRMEGCQISGSKSSMQALTIRLLFCKWEFFSAGCAGVFLVTRSTTLTHVVHCTCLPSFAIGAHVSTSANKHAQFSSLVSWNVDFKQPCTFPGLWQGLLKRLFQMSRYTESGSGSHIVQIIGQCRWHIIKKYQDV